MQKINIKALWLDPNVGLNGYLGAVLADGTPVALCSKEKFDLGPYDSLRKGWVGNVRIGNKVMHAEKPESLEGFTLGGKALTIPAELQFMLQPAPVEQNPLSLAYGDMVLVNTEAYLPDTHPARRYSAPTPRRGVQYLVVTSCHGTKYAVNGCAWYPLDALIFIGRATAKSIKMADSFQQER